MEVLAPVSFETVLITYVKRHSTPIPPKTWAPPLLQIPREIVACIVSPDPMRSGICGSVCHITSGVKKNIDL